MAKIGEYRLKIYDLLYQKPICNYIEITDNKKEMNVLILGNGWAGSEAFKAVFWAGQYIDTQLNITVASKNALEFEKNIMDGNILPAMKQFAIDKGYANLSFNNILVTDGGINDLSSLKFESKKYNYIVVAFGTSDLNWLASVDIINHISDAKNAGLIDYTGKVLVNIFDDFEDKNCLEDRELLVNEAADKGIEINFIQELKPTEELERLARNINFSYNMKYNQRIGKGESDRSFEQSKNREFIQSPYHYEVDDIKVLSNFIGGDYAADSSYASAVHIPYKLSLCDNGKGSCLDTLYTAIKTKNDLYKKLVVLEHRRWNAYMVMRGFRAPTIQEEECLLYHKGNTHQVKQERLHICLCDCNDKGVLLGEDFNKKYKQWIEKKCPIKMPSELDRASLRCHQLVSRLSNKINVETVYKYIVGEDDSYINYRKSIKKLLNDEENSLVVYEKAYNEAVKYAKKISQEEYDKIKTADEVLSVAKVRNKRLDFLSLDAQLINMLPFVMWYGKKYQKCITVSNGEATQDVIVPTIFSVEQALYIGTEVNDEKYRSKIHRYFYNRGNITENTFISIKSYNQEDILCVIGNILDNCKNVDEVIINYVPHSKPEVPMLIGRLAERYSGINIISYDEKDGIISLAGDKNIDVGLEGKSFNVNEYIELMGAKITNEHKILYASKEYPALLELFQKFGGTNNFRTSSGKKIKYALWNNMATFYRSSKETDIEKMLLSERNISGVYDYEGKFSLDVFDTCQIETLLNKLVEFKIINDLSIHRTSIVTVLFKYYDSALYEVFQKFELVDGVDACIEEKIQKRIKFSTMGGIKIMSMAIKNKKLVSDGEDPESYEIKVKFLKELQNYGFISNLEFDDDRNVCFSFKDEETRNIFHTQGTVLELIMYHLLKESGLFDDVETRTKISWDLDEVSLDKLIYENINRKENNVYGYKQYKDMREKVTYEVVKNTSLNEIDIIATKGMNAYFFSCKTGNKDKLEWIYEIVSLASHFRSKAALITSNCYSVSSTPFSERAKQMYVSLLGTETLWDEGNLQRALHIITNGNVYSCIEK